MGCSSQPSQVEPATSQVGTSGSTSSSATEAATNSAAASVGGAPGTTSQSVTLTGAEATSGATTTTASGAATATSGGGASTSAGSDTTTTTGNGGTTFGSTNTTQAATATTASVNACAQPGVLLCDDFEAADPSSWPSGSDWLVEKIGAGTVEVDTTIPAHSGTHSIHVRGNDSDYQTFFVHRGNSLPSPQRRLYIRAYLRLAVPMAEPHNTYFKAGYYPDGSGNDPYETRVGVHMQMLDINQQEGDRGYLSNNNYWTDMQIGPGLFANEWRCVEVLLDHANSEINVWLEGEELSDLHHTDWLQDDYDTLSFGFEKYGGPATDVWYDDIVVSSEPIGCL